MIIHLNGMPGVGKLTVAKVLAATLPARLIDNHLIIDLVVNTCGRGGPGYIPMITDITRIVHDVLVRHAADETIIFTNALAKDLPEDVARLAAVENLAAEMQKPFVPILLHCDADENAARLVSPDRKNKGKLMDQDNLKSLIAQYHLAHPQDHPNALRLDTTHLSPDAAAAKISAHLLTVQ